MATPSAFGMPDSVVQDGNAPMRKCYGRKCYEFGEGRYLRITASFVVLEDEINEKRVVLNFQKFVKITSRLDDIDEAIVKQRLDSRAHYRQDIGGSWFVTIGNGYRCVDIRKWFTDRNGKSRPTRNGMSLRYVEWDKFKEIANDVRHQRPDVAAVEPCYQSGDHQNQEGEFSVLMFLVACI